MPELEIIGAPQSNYVWVSRIACHEKGVPYNLIPVMPHTAEVDAVHPLGKIPALRHGDFMLAESRAICFYIDHAFDGPPLVPRDVAGGAKTEQWISIVNTHFDVLVARPYVGAYFFPGTSDGSPNRAVIEGVLPKLESQFAILDRAVAKTGHLVGNTFTLADMNVLPMQQVGVVVQPVYQVAPLVPVMQVQTGPTSPMASASLVLGLLTPALLFLTLVAGVRASSSPSWLSFVLTDALSLICALLAVVFGHIALHAVHHSAGRLKGSGLAVIGAQAARSGSV